MIVLKKTRAGAGSGRRRASAAEDHSPIALGAAAFLSAALLPQPLYVSANGIIASVLGGEEACSLLVRCHCGRCKRRSALIYPAPAAAADSDGGGAACKPGRSRIHHLRSWAVHVGALPPPPDERGPGAAGSTGSGDGAPHASAMQQHQALMELLRAGDAPDIELHNVRPCLHGGWAHGCWAHGCMGARGGVHAAAGLTTPI